MKKERKAVLATLDESERDNYARATAHWHDTRIQFLAASAYLDQLGVQIQAAHELPPQFDIDLKTGKVTERDA